MARQQFDDSPASSDPREAAEQAGLVYVSDTEPGIRREPATDGFAYFKPNGGAVTDERTLERIRKLAIPPAWTDVWICTRANGHIQATGRDARGRKQYRYHPQFREVRESTKYGHMIEFARALPALRGRIAHDMARRGLPREKVLATVVHLLETTLIRVGNDEYTRENNSFGLTTLRNRHVKVNGSELKFQFAGKGGKKWQLQVKNPRVARIVRALQDLPGQELFQYRGEDGNVQRITSSDVNEYLRAATGQDVTAKDFRTWAGTVLAAFALRDVEQADTQAAQKRNIKAAIERVAARLGNTPTICRKCYVHPEVLQAYIEGALALEVGETQDGELGAEETAVLALLETRLNRTLGESLKASLRAVAQNARSDNKTRSGSQR